MREETSTAAGGERVGLVRDLGLFDITMVGVGAMIGAGIFVLTGIAAGAAGPALILSFALNGIVTVFTAMVYAELGSAIPEAGGGYLWVKEGMPAWNAFMAGWMSWFAHAVAGSLYALGFGSYLELLFQEYGVSFLGLTGPALHKTLAVGVALLFVGINFKGVSETGTIGNFVTVGKVAILGVFVASGLWAISREPGSLEKFTPFAPEGISGVLVAMGLTFIAFEGYEIIVQAGEEVKNPRETIPKAVFLSLAIVVPIYMLVAFAALGAVSPEGGEATWRWLGDHAEVGLVQAARQFMPFGTILLLVGGLLSTMSALNATTFSSTRVSFAMGRDRNLPDLFGAIHESTRTPYLALLASGALIVFMSVIVPIEDVASAADVMFLLLFLQVNVAVITIRKKYGDKLDYGYLVPFFPVVPIIGIVTKLFLAVFMYQYSVLAWISVGLWIAAGFAVYVLYARDREREKEATPVAFRERHIPEEDRFRVVASVAGSEPAPTLIAIGARIAEPMDGEVVLLNVATVPRQTPLRAGRRHAEDGRRIVRDALEKVEPTGVPSRTVIRIGHAPSQGILDTQREWDADFVLMGWHSGPGHRRRRLGHNIREVMQRSPANVLAVQEAVRIPARRILVPVARPRSAALLVGLARLLLDDDEGSRIVAFHVVPPGLDAYHQERRVEEIREGLAEPAFFDEGRVDLEAESISVEVVESRNVAQAIGNASGDHDLMIVGSGEESWLRRRVIGSRPYWAAQKADCPVILVNQETGRLKFSFQTFFQFFRELEPEVAEKEDTMRRGNGK